MPLRHLLFDYYFYQFFCKFFLVFVGEKLCKLKSLTCRVGIFYCRISGAVDGFFYSAAFFGETGVKCAHYFLLKHEQTQT